MSTPPEPRAARLRWRTRLRIAAPFIALVVVLALLWSIVLVGSTMQRQRLLDETQRGLIGIGRATAEQTEGVLRDAESALRVVDLWLRDTPAAADDARLAHLARTLLASSRGMVEVALATPQGALRRLSTPGSATPEAQLAPLPGLQKLTPIDEGEMTPIGDPVRLTPTGPRLLPIALRLHAPVGEWRWAIALIDLDRLGRIHQSLAREPAGAVGLVRSDGLVISRVPEVPGLAGRNAFDGAPERRRVLERESGAFVTDSRLTDGVPRVMAFHRIEGRPLLVLISQGLDAALVTFDERRRIVISVCSAMSVLALAITWVLAGAQRRARLRDAELLATVDASPLGLFRTNADGEPVYANEAYFRIHGLSPDQLRTGWLTLLLPQERDAEQRVWREVVARGESLSTVRAYTRPDGKQVMLALRTAPLRIGERIVGQAGTVQDVTEQLASERAQQTLNAIFDATPDAVLQMDTQGRLLYMNPAARIRLGVARLATLEGLRFDGFHPPAMAQRLRDEAWPHATEHGYWSGRGVVFDARGRELPVDETLLAHRGRDGRIETYSAVLRDMSAEIQAQQQLERSEAIMAAVAQSHTAMIMVLDTNQRFLFMNRACERAFGVQRSEWIGRPVHELLGRADYLRTLPLIETALTGEPAQAQVSYPDRLGRAIFNLRCVPFAHADGVTDSGATANVIDGVIAIADDITDSKHEESRLRDASQTDALTELRNRLGFERHADELIALARQDNSLIAVLYLDLDHFKPVNDTHGHPVGDALLRAVAGRLRHALRPQDLVARLGGDEFVVMLPGLRAPADAQLIARKLVELMAAPFLIGKLVLSIGVSVGISMARGNAAALDTLVRDADAQLYAAKRAGRGTVCGDVRVDAPGSPLAE